MENTQFLEHDDVNGQIYWDDIFRNPPEGLFDFDPVPISDSPVILESPPELTAATDAFSKSSPDSVSSWIDEIEGLLMENDAAADKVEEPSVELYEKYLADVLVESPPQPTDGGLEEVIDAQIGTSDSDVGSGGTEHEKVGGAEANENGETVEDDDPASKKRRRQLRNKDAAVRSRERKKLHVKDLEVKSRYLEGECRRLGRLLQCFMAENHALRLTLQNGSVATMTKQESAVLLLESLLLGSLLWFLGLTCLFTLPVEHLSAREGAQQGSVEEKSLVKQAPREARSKMFGSLLQPCCMRSRRCRASRTRMRMSTLVF